MRTPGSWCATPAEICTWCGTRREGANYLVRYAISSNNGATWTQSDVYTSPFETYHPAIAIGPADLYVAFPSRSSASAPYQVLFTSKPLTGGSWATPTPADQRQLQRRAARYLL